MTKCRLPKFPITNGVLITLVIVCMAQSIQSQTQIGLDIDGEAADDGSGNAVSLSADGLKLAVGAYLNDGAGANAGHVRVYNRAGNNWVQQGVDIDGEATGDVSGYSLSLSSNGNILAVGAIYNDGNGSNSGHVRIFTWNGSAWTQLGNDIDGEMAGDYSGNSISLSDDGLTVAVGAYDNDGSFSSAGHVRVFNWNGSDWIQMGADIDGEAAYDYFGNSVSLSDDGLILAVGGPFNDGSGLNAGHVRVFNWNGSDWIQLGSDIDGEAPDDQSGYSVSLSADGLTVAIGALFNDGSTWYSGHVRVYLWNGISWVQQGSDIDGEAPDDQSGYSVSISDNGSRIAIGAIANGDNGLESGHVRLYDWNGSTWVQFGNDIDGEAAFDYSGYSVSLSGNGNTVSIGAINNDGNGLGSGHVRVFGFCESSTASLSVNQCFDYEVPSGDETYSMSGIYLDTIPNICGGDSLITITLTIPTVDIGVTNASTSLTANASGAVYQWIDCANDNVLIPGENGQSFTASINGSYAVIVTENDCTDTSACFTVNNVGIGNLELIKCEVFPNPSVGEVCIRKGTTSLESVKVFDLMGQELSIEQCFTAEGLIRINLLDKVVGVMILQLDHGNGNICLERIIFLK